MADDDAIEHHRAIEYVEVQVGANDSFTRTPLPGGRGFVVEGICPGCGGRTTMTIPPGIAGGQKGRRDHRSRSAATETTVLCLCGYVHENRPSDAFDRGCGRFWTVPLT